MNTPTFDRWVDSLERCLRGLERRSRRRILIIFLASLAVLMPPWGYIDPDARWTKLGRIFYTHFRGFGFLFHRPRDEWGYDVPPLITTIHWKFWLAEAVFLV